MVACGGLSEQADTAELREISADSVEWRGPVRMVLDGGAEALDRDVVWIGRIQEGVRTVISGAVMGLNGVRALLRPFRQRSGSAAGDTPPSADIRSDATRD